MPGIVGIMGEGSNPERGLALEQMLRCILHEPFYRSGVYINDQLGVWLGWTCHEGSFADCHPVVNERGDIVLLFSGEHFADGCESARDLVSLYERHGLQFLEQLNGWFSGVLLDLREQKAVLFNDRYGLGRVYYAQLQNCFWFSSEAKSLLKVLPEARQLNLQSLGEAISCGCVLQNRSLFSSISLLPGGSAWTLARGRLVHRGTYFRPDAWECQPTADGGEFTRKLQSTFSRILPRYLRGRQRIGVSLTGGLDGRLIMAWAPNAPGTLPCYTFGGEYRDCADVKVARTVAKACQQSHQVLPVGRGFCREFWTLAEKAVYISDGTMDVTGSVELYANMLARHVAPVRLTGNYGSEILRGNVAFKPERRRCEAFAPEIHDLVQAACTTYAEEAKCHPLTFIAFKQVPWHHYSRLSVEQSQLTMRAPYLDNDLVALMYQAPPALVVSKRPCLQLIAEGNPLLSRIPTDRGLGCRRVTWVPNVRHLFAEFTFKAEYAYDYGMPQWLAAMDGCLRALHLERIFLGRHKFYHFRIWYRDDLVQTVRDILLDPRTQRRPYLRGAQLEKLIKAHASGYQNHTADIHVLLTVELIQRKLLEDN